MATTDMTRYKKFVDFQDISGETVPTNDGAFFYKDSAFETNSKINVAGDVSSSANIYAGGRIITSDVINTNGINSHIFTNSDSSRIFTQGENSVIYTSGAGAHILTYGGGDISSSANVYAVGNIVAGDDIKTNASTAHIYTEGPASHIFTSGSNSSIFTKDSGGHIFTFGGGNIYTVNGGDIKTFSGGNISSSANVYALGNMVADGDITSNGGNVAVQGGGDILATRPGGAIAGGDIKTLGGGHVSSSGNIYALGQISTSGDVVSSGKLISYTGEGIISYQGGDILAIDGGNISSSANVYALGNMVAQGAITGSGIHSSGDFSSGGNISTIGGGNISSSANIYAGGRIITSNVINTNGINSHIFTNSDSSRIFTQGENSVIYTGGAGAHIMTVGGGDISSSANVYAAQTIGVGKVADSGYAIDVANGLGDIRASAFVTYSDRNLKQNINPINNALEKVMKLEAVSYEMKGNQKQEIGFIAQDVAKIIPEICAIGDDGEGKGIDYSRLTSMLVGAIKAQQQQIEELKAIIKK